MTLEPTVTNTENNHWQSVWRDPAELKPNPVNPRVITNENVHSLVESIQSGGVKVPLHITPDNVILGGHRRQRAAILAGVQSVPCIIRDIPPAEHLMFIIDENVQRASLSVIEEAEIYEKLLASSKSVQDLCRRNGLSPARVNGRLLLLKLPEPVRQMYHENKIPLKAAPWLTGIDDEDMVIGYAKLLAELIPLNKLQAQHKRFMEAKVVNANPPATSAHPVTQAAAPRRTKEPQEALLEQAAAPRRTKEPQEALLEVDSIEQIRDVYLEQPPFLVSSGKLAKISRQTCKECGNTDAARCQTCPLYLFLKALPVPTALEQLVQKQGV
jgi:ParB family chromosome partitioning protein